MRLGGSERVHEKGNCRMTFREKLKQEHPEQVSDSYIGGVYGCPYTHGYEESWPCDGTDYKVCRACWDRQMLMTTEEGEAPAAPHEIPQSVRKVVEARIKLLTEEITVESEQIKALEAERDALCDYLRGENNG